MDREPAGPGHDDSGDEPDHPGQPVERHYQEGDELGSDHRGPTLITGFYGMNVPYPGFSKPVGLATSIAIMITAALVLYITFKRKDWL